MKIKINVKEQHITDGRCSKAFDCAIARAVQDIMPQVAVMNFGNNFEIVIIDYSKSDGRVLMATLPISIGHKIELFDSFDDENIVGKARLAHLKPFSFEVDVDESLLFPDKLLEEIEQIIEGSNNVELVTV